EEDNDTLLEKARELQRKDQISLEEQALVDVLLVLIERFEEEHYGSKKAQPDAVLRELMRARDLKPKDLYNIFGGSKGTTSEVLRGKRSISKSAAKALAERFGVSAELFL